ncbi:phosphodiesterase [Bacillus coahuilensis m2-6]|uniref:metallophosphoesterase family protein n=1 Tax=Bacillus coahuilensis TaxID=408580 RepID=UPI0001850D37|nr:metallophosphoesterase [Bacillus coahuilensis]KUP08169.1 phosphodiesterase [Bacillus coahuilensis m2-6]
MRVIVVSDTHIPKGRRVLPKKLIRDIQTCQLVIHCGDFHTIETFERMKLYADLLAVYGNVDDSQIVEVLSFKEIVELEGVKVGVTHGHGKGKTTLKRVMDLFTNQDVDLVLFGHFHIPFHEKIDEKTYFNPGSPTDKRREKYFSYGILTIQDNLFTIRHEWIEE